VLFSFTKLVHSTPLWIFSTNFGTSSCFSEAGDKFLSVFGCGVIDVFDFDRCTGQLSNYLPLDKTTPPYLPEDPFYYGCSFSPDGTKIYVSSYGSSDLYQYDLSAKDVKKSRKIIHRYDGEGGEVIGFSQHQLGPDGKIYINSGVPISRNITKLSIIHQPNLAGKACQFDTSGINIIGLQAGTGLPNFPNYRIADPITAFAGKDTMLCAGESLRLGQNVQDPKLIYEWTPKEGLDNSNSPNPLATPTQTTAYVLTVRPQPTVPEACRSRSQHSDTVFVKVIEKHVPPCTSVSRSKTILEKPFSIYPNPAQASVQVQYDLTEEATGLSVRNAIGVEVSRRNLNGKKGNLEVDTRNLPAGMYVIQIKGTDQKVLSTQKLMIVK
jgi:hypothetical protein